MSTKYYANLLLISEVTQNMDLSKFYTMPFRLRPEGFILHEVQWLNGTVLNLTLFRLRPEGFILHGVQWLNVTVLNLALFRLIPEGFILHEVHGSVVQCFIWHFFV